MTPPVRSCRDCRDRKIKCTGDYDFSQGEKCDPCKKSRSKKPCSSRELPSFCWPKPESHGLKGLWTRSTRALMPRQESLTPPLTQQQHQQAGALGSPQIAARGTHVPQHAATSPSQRLPAHVSKLATGSASSYDTYFEREALIKELKSIQGHRECHTFLQPRLDALSLARPIHPSRSVSHAAETYKQCEEILQSTSDRLRDQYESAISRLDQARCQNDPILMQYVASLIDNFSDWPPSINDLATYPSILAHSSQQSGAKQASVLWDLIRKNDENGLKSAADRLCIKVSQLGSISAFSLIEPHSQKKRLLQAFNRTARRIVTAWQKCCPPAAELGDICSMSQLVSIYHADWLLDRPSTTTKHGDVLDKVFSRTRLHLFCEHLHSSSEDSFWETHQDLVEDKDDIGMTPMHVAAAKGCLMNIKSLLDRGARHDRLDIYGRTPLVVAAGAGHDEVVYHLSSLDQPYRERGPLEQHPTIPAAASGKISSLRLLHMQGFSVGIKQDGKRPSQVARENSHKEVADFLENLESMPPIISPAGEIGTLPFAFQSDS